MLKAASGAAENKDESLLKENVVHYLELALDALKSVEMKEEKISTAKDRWLRKVTRTPPSASIREQRKQAKRDRKRSIRKCRLSVVAKQRKTLQKLTDKSRKGQYECTALQPQLSGC